ncbi:MAG: hypothetical protein ACE366_19305 [Bradymonadia bacterium]
MPLPLKFRLPNPPPHAAGRTAEIEALRAALRQGPVVQIWGPPGIGRRTLAQMTLHRHFKRKVEQTLVVSSPEAHAPLAQWLLHALSRAAGLNHGPEQAVEDPLSEAVALAEVHRWWVVIDAAGSPDAGALVDLVSQYGRHSHWLVLSWRHQGLASIPHIPLSTLPRETLDVIADAWSASDDLRAQAHTHGGGSPLHFIQLLSGARDPQRLWLEGLSPSAQDALYRLALLRGIPTEDDLINAEDLSMLRRRGLVLFDGDLLHAHPAVREGLQGTPESLARRRETATALAQRTAPECLIESLRLWLQLGDEAAACRLLTAHGQTLLDHCGRLWPLLAPVESPALRPWRMRAAVAMGSRAALATLPADPPEDAELRSVWARGVMLAGDPARALEALDGLGPSTALATALCLMNLGHYDDALLHLTPPAHQASAGYRGAVIRVVALSHLDRRDDALREAMAQQRRFSATPDTLVPTPLLDLARALITLGALEPAREVMALARPLIAQMRPSPQRTSALLIDAGHSLTQGDLTACGERLESLRLMTHCGGLLSVSVQLLTVEHAILAGDFDGLWSTLTTLQADTLINSTDVFAHAVGAAIEEVGRVEGRPPNAPLLDVSPAFRGPLRILRARRALRHGDLWATTDPGSHPHGQLLAYVLRGERAALNDQLSEGIRAQTEGIELAEAQGDRRALAELRCTLGDLSLLTGDIAQVQTQSEALDVLAQEMGSLRYAHRARLMAWMAHTTPRPLGPLEELAASPHVSPTAARRAQWLLGGDPPLDQLDLQICQRLSRSSTRPGQSHAATPWTPGWGVDEARQCIWRPHGAEIALSPLLWRIMVSLARAGGALDKEALCTQVWGEADYHPLRHDNRLHANIKKLRHALGDTGPQWLLTTAEGYTLAGAWGWRRAANT